MPSLANTLQGIVVETRTESLTGKLFYSDRMHDEFQSIYPQHPLLNSLSKIYFIGMAAGVIRMALAAIHTVGHLLAAALTWDKGHCYHAAKGGCEFLRGLIEAIPVAGRIFARWYNQNGDWWIIKIYNPDKPDTLDKYAEYWSGIKANRPEAYITA